MSLLFEHNDDCEGNERLEGNWGIWNERESGERETEGRRVIFEV